MNSGTAFFLGLWIGVLFGCSIGIWAWKRDFYFNDRIYNDFVKKREEARAKRRAKYEAKLRKVQ